jgi:FMN-dependent NADH-azoreductase
MTHLLQIDASPRGDRSESRLLHDKMIDQAVHLKLEG